MATSLQSTNERTIKPKTVAAAARALIDEYHTTEEAYAADNRLQERQACQLARLDHHASLTKSTQDLYRRYQGHWLVSRQVPCAHLIQHYINRHRIFLGVVQEKASGCNSYANMISCLPA